MRNRGEERTKKGVGKQQNERKRKEGTKRVRKGRRVGGGDVEDEEGEEKGKSGGKKRRERVEGRR